MRAALSIQFGLLLILAFTAALNVVGIGFGMPRHYDPSVDSIHPALSLDAFDAIAGNRHPGGLKYPRVQLVVLGAVQRGWLLARHGSEGAASGNAIVARLRGLAPRSSIEARDAFREFASVIAELIVVGRVITAAFGVLLVFALFRFTRELGGPSAGLVAAFLTAVSFPVVYYAHTLNVDVPCLALSFLALSEGVVAVRGRCARRLVLSAVLAALAIGIKDQAYAFFLGAIPIALFEWRRPRSTAGEPSAIVLSRGSWAALIVALVVASGIYALSQGLPFDREGVRKHFEHIFGAGSQTYRIYSRDLPGQWLLLRETGIHLISTLSWPLALLALAGLVSAWRRDRRIAMWLALPALGVHFTFQAPIGYTYLRFTLPIALLGLVAVALLIGSLLRDRLLRFPAVLILIVLAGERAQRSIEVDRMLLEDPQARASEWLAANVATGETVFAALELPLHNVDLPPAAATRYFDPTTTPELAPGEVAPRTIVFAVYDPLATAYQPTPPWVAAPASMTAFGCEYHAVVTFAPSLPHPIRRGAAFCPTVVVLRRDLP